MPLHFHFSIGDIRELRKLSRIKRLFHPKTRRHVLGLLLGIALMMTGSSLALNHWDKINHVVWDMSAYLIHAIGTIPILKHVEPVWSLIMLETESL